MTPNTASENGPPGTPYGNGTERVKSWKRFQGAHSHKMRNIKTLSPQKSTKIHLDKGGEVGGGIFAWGANKETCDLKKVGLQRGDYLQENVKGVDQESWCLVSEYKRQGFRKRVVLKMEVASHEGGLFLGVLL